MIEWRELTGQELADRELEEKIASLIQEAMPRNVAWWRVSLAANNIMRALASGAREE